jgi:flavin-dependent thymidylate synthase
MTPYVKLAGFNVDADLLAEVVETLRRIEAEAPGGNYSGGGDSRALAEQLGVLARDRLAAESFTPETIAAAYARISRDPCHVSELRQSARFGVSRARKSNETIIFGLGHASVAEHACFNFDVAGISRLASEELQSHRLLSFTEKSQRYITVGSDYIIPHEAAAAGVAAEFTATIPQLFAAYDRLTTALATRYKSDAAPDASRNELRDLETRAKEDTRYLLPLACATQMGMTMNARNIEHVVRDLSDHPLHELRALGSGIASAVGTLAPSLVKYTVRGEYPRANRAKLQAHWAESTAREHAPLAVHDGPAARIVAATPDGDQRILAALRFAAGRARYQADARADAGLWLELFRAMTPHDPALREFEFAELTFEAEISASCFAQLKRHRMMSLIAQGYDTEAGIVLPPSIRDAGMEAEFLAAVATALDATRRAEQRSPLLYPYLLTNAQRRRVLLKANARELYHFARLRSDAHAQWEIRALSAAMMAQARELWPQVFLLACGKDAFAATYERLFG